MKHATAYSDLPELSDEQIRDVSLEVADSFGRDQYRDALADQIETLSDAHYMLDLLFKYDITVLQAMEMTKNNPHHIRYLRTLRNLTEQCDKGIREKTTDKERELADEMAESARRDADDARAA